MKYQRGWLNHRSLSAFVCNILKSYCNLLSEINRICLKTGSSFRRWLIGVLHALQKISGIFEEMFAHELKAVEWIMWQKRKREEQTWIVVVWPSEFQSTYSIGNSDRADEEMLWMIGMIEMSNKEMFQN